MPRHHIARFAVILLVAATLAAPPAWGAPHGLAAEMNPLGMFSRAWASIAAIWAETSCGLRGGCTGFQGGARTAQQGVPTPPPATDAGCTADPHGGCSPGS